jgi:NAD(P)H-quinone oxidoreductase subunit 5
LQWGATALAFVMGLLFILSFTLPGPLLLEGLSLNRVNCSLGLLVAVVGAVVIKYTHRYLNGDPKQNAFTSFLALSVSSALGMMLADNLILLAGGWAITSVGLHFLLTHYNSEPDALVVARKKFLISRLGDLALFLALISIYQGWGTLSLSHLFERMGATHHAPIAAVWLICIAAITKSAQFPFHTWLPETLASPTPVSALMHAGIINGGGALLLKFAPALVQVPLAGLFLAIVGSVTTAIGMVSMWGQTSIKRKLAWSTVSQMGFMTAECGISAFVAALIHIVAHGLYKATAFLNSGTLEPISPRPNRLTGVGTLAILLLGLVLAIPIQVFLHAGGLAPAQMAVILMTGIAVGHVLVALHTNLSLNRSSFQTWLTMLLASQVLALLSAITFRVATEAMQLPMPATSPITTFTCAVPVVTLAGLSIYRAFEAEIQTSALGRALFVHSQNGFYIGLLADKIVARFGKPLLTKI